MFRSSRGTYCDFTATSPYEDAFENQTIDSCKLIGATGVSLNVNFCVDEQGELANCAANCRGVDPNSIIGGGVAAVAVTAAAGQAFIGPALGLGALGVAGAGAGAAMMGLFSPCPRTRPCRVRERG